jgi:predicted ATP-dependent endonuclease of OLD family
MKIQRVKIKNFRNIEDIQSDINGSNILLIGENTRGKSNFIKAIETALGITSHAAIDPIMHGKEDANIEVVLGEDGKEYKFEVKFESGSDRPMITVTTPEGVFSKAKSTIGSIVGEIEFDVDEFVEMSDSDRGRKDQVEIVKSFLDPEIREQINEFEKLVQRYYEERTDINRSIKAIEGFIQKSTIDEHTAILYGTTIDTTEIQERLTRAVKQSENIAKAEEKCRSYRSLIDSNKALIAKLQLEIDQAEESLDKIGAWLKTNPQVDKDGIMEELNHANAHNARCKDVESYVSHLRELKSLKEDSENLTIKVETVRQSITDTIREIDMPVEGLSFEGDQLTYHGRPVNKNTMSTSEIMMLGVQLKIAKNPNAHVIFIQRGESMGTEKLRDLQKMASEYNYQIIMEQMERGVDQLQIQIMPEY